MKTDTQTFIDVRERDDNGRFKPKQIEQPAPNRRSAVADKAQHSPLPWHMANEDSHRTVTIWDGRSTVIADIYGLSRDERAANAKLIVASVNHADKLAEALRDCITSPGALAEKSHEYSLRRLKTITEAATEALTAYEAAQ